MPDPSTMYQALLVLSVVVFFGMAVIYSRSECASAFHPITVYLAFHFITFVVRPLIVYFRQDQGIYDLYQFFPSWSDKITVLLAANLGLVVFVGAGLFFGRAALRFERHEAGQLDGYVVPLLITCAIVLPPAIMSFVAVYSGGELNTLDRATGVTISAGTNGYLQAAQLMLATLTGLIAYIFRFRWWSLLPFAAFVVVRAGTGGRGPFIAAIFYLTLLYLFTRRRRWVTASSAVLAALGMTLFRIVGNDRGAAIQALMGLSPQRGEVHPERFLESMDWANLEFFEYLVHSIPGRTGTYDYFASLLQVFTEPIPRALWIDKPIGAPIKLFNLFDYGFPIGMTFSLPGAGWYELGWVGVVVLTVAFAALYGTAYNRFARSNQTPFGLMLYGAFATTSIIAFRDGQVLSILKQSLFYLTPVVILEAVARAYRYRGAEAAWHSAGLRGRRPPASSAPLTPRERRHARALLARRPAR